MLNIITLYSRIDCSMLCYKHDTQITHHINRRNNEDNGWIGKAKGVGL